MINLSDRNKEIKNQLIQNHRNFKMDVNTMYKDIVNLTAQMVVEGIQMSQETKNEEN